MGIIIRQSIKGTVVNFIGVAIGFITTFVVVIRYLTPEEIGLTRILVDAATLFSGFALLGTSSSMVRFYPFFKNNEQKDHGFFFWSIAIPLIGFILIALCFFFLKNTIINAFADKSPLFLQYFYLLLPLTFCMTYLSIFELNSNLLMRIVVPTFIREIGIRVLLLCAYLLYAFKILSLDHFVLVFCSVYAIAAICNIIYLISLKKVSFKPDFKHLTKSLQKSFLYYTLFLLIGTLIGSITATINTFFVSAKMGLAYTGIFSIATYIAAIIEIPYRSLGAITQPQIAQTVKENNFDETSKLCKNISLHQFIVSTFLFFTIWVNIQLIFQILPNGNEYMAGIWVVFFLGLTRIITSSFGVGISILGYSKYYYYSLFLSILLAGTAIFLNLWLIPLYGIEGAALATFLSTCLDSIFLLTLNKIKLNITPFSIAQLKIVLILLLMFGFNRIWNFALTPFFSQLPIKELYCSILSNSLGTFFTLGAGIVILYCWKVSETVNHLIRKAFKII